MAQKIDEYFRRELILRRNERMGNRVVEILRANPDQSFFFAFGAGKRNKKFPFAFNLFLFNEGLFSPWLVILITKLQVVVPSLSQIKNVFMKYSCSIYQATILRRRVNIHKSSIHIQMYLYTGLL